MVSCVSLYVARLEVSVSLTNYTPPEIIKSAGFVSSVTAVTKDNPAMGIKCLRLGDALSKPQSNRKQQ